MFPEYNRRAGRLISLGDRIVDCFLRSQNATGRPASENDGHAPAEAAAQLPSPTSKEVLAVSAYLTWLSNGSALERIRLARTEHHSGRRAPSRSTSWIPERGESHIHGALHVVPRRRRPGGRGWETRKPDRSGDPIPGTTAPVRRASIRWPGSFASTMPYLDPGGLTDEDAQQLAEFINSKPRPVFPFKDQDYLVRKAPVDSVYYPQRSRFDTFPDSTTRTGSKPDCLSDSDFRFARKSTISRGMHRLLIIEPRGGFMVGTGRPRSRPRRVEPKSSSCLRRNRHRAYSCTGTRLDGRLRHRRLARG